MANTTNSPEPDGQVSLAINELAHLFNAPPVDPFTGGEAEVIGRAGLVLLQQRLKQAWPRPVSITQVVVRLPADRLPQEPAALKELTVQTEAAIRRYCAAQIAANEQARRLAFKVSLRQTILVAVFSLLTLAYGYALLNGQLTLLSPIMQGVIFIVALLAASLALWDALDALLFQWAPFVLDNRAYAALARCAVTLAPLAAHEESLANRQAVP